MQNPLNYVPLAQLCAKLCTDIIAKFHYPYTTHTNTHFIFIRRLKNIQHFMQKLHKRKCRHTSGLCLFSCRMIFCRRQDKRKICSSQCVYMQECSSSRSCARILQEATENSNVPTSATTATQTSINIHCVPKKTCGHVFDNNLNQKRPFFATPVTKTIGYQQVFLVFHLTNLVQLLYLGKLLIPKCHEFSLKLQIFPMLQFQDIKCKTVAILFYL